MHDAERSAAGALAIAEQRMLSKYAFHARLLATWDRRASRETETMGVTVRRGRVSLLYAPEFVVGCTILELVGVLLHEVNHVVFGHLLMTREDFPDRRALIIAQEVTVNEHVLEPLPGAPIILSMFPQLPEGESTKRRYERLAQVGGGAGEQPNTLDDHAHWEAAAKDPHAAKSIAASVLEAREIMSNDEWAAVADDVRDAAEAMVAALVGRGVGAGTESRAVDGGTPRVNWRAVLRRFVGSAMERESTLAWPSRRLPHLVGTVPGSRNRPKKPRLMAVIDTSGSITPQLLADISQELLALRALVEVLVVECDFEVHRVYRMTAPIVNVQGGGGTDLCPPLHEHFISEQRAELVVYFTDGFGPAPEQAPRVPVLWSIVPGGQKPATWGSVVQMGP
ncbi:MAG: VWA-like domain-containing protein [Deltaproteobacteria bacterium]|nr:VWA-like domain-containing protein [Deltaproteobacteria bacterium]